MESKQAFDPNIVYLIINGKLEALSEYKSKRIKYVLRTLDENIKKSQEVKPEGDHWKKRCEMTAEEKKADNRKRREKRARKNELLLTEIDI
jgi:hypothetical protein